MEVLSPLTGTVVALSQVPDPVFAGAMVGPGLAVDPSRDGRQTAIAPVAGSIVKLHAHAFVISTEGGQAILVHLGIDTVQLRGEGFELHAAEGDTIAAGQPLVSWDPGDIAENGRSPISPVVALEGKADALTEMHPGGAVSAGDVLFDWAP